MEVCVADSHFSISPNAILGPKEPSGPNEPNEEVTGG
jgi:hypothetical protein